MAMTMTMSMTLRPSQLLIDSRHSTVRIIPTNFWSSDAAIYPATRVSQGLLKHSSFSHGDLRSYVKPLYAAGSGLEASVADDETLIRIKNAKIAVESQDAEKIQVRVDVKGEDTRIVFEKVLTNLARSAPPVPGFRRQKGGKTTKVPTDFLLQIIGEDRVINFVIREIVTSTVADYVKKENLAVKENKISTTQTSDELKSSFTPGADFGFNATFELEESTAEADT